MVSREMWYAVLCWKRLALQCNSQPSVDESNTKRLLLPLGDCPCVASEGSHLLRGRHTPMTMEGPSALLALLAAIFGATAAATFRKLACVLLPLAALVVSTLSNSSTGIIFAAKISHHNACPVLHIGRVVAYGKLLNKWEEVEVIREEVLSILLVLFVNINVKNLLLLALGIECC